MINETVQHIYELKRLRGFEPHFGYLLGPKVGIWILRRIFIHLFRPNKSTMIIFSDNHLNCNVSKLISK